MIYERFSRLNLFFLSLPFLSPTPSLFLSLFLSFILCHSKGSYCIIVQMIQNECPQIEGLRMKLRQKLSLLWLGALLRVLCGVAQGCTGMRAGLVRESTGDFDRTSLARKNVTDT